jgi:hypothetical protein
MEFIKMKVKGLPTLPIEEFENFQGKLKFLSPESAKKLKASMIKNGFNAPIFIWAGHKYILDGHQRIKVLLELYAEGYSLEGEPVLPYVEIEAENEKQAAEMVLTYNSQYGHLDHTSLLEFAKTFELDIQSLPEILDLKDISIEKFVFDINPDIAHNAGTLKNDYIMAPFSILDTRSAEWQERKRAWLSKMPQLDKTREGVLKYSKVTSLKDQFTGGSSIFDPVLAELMYAWFCPKGGKTLDIYMGESTKAFVACLKGLQYSGVEIRQEQIDENGEFMKRVKLESYYKFVHGDAKNVQVLLNGEQFDFAFTSPPYYDLEEYEGGGARHQHKADLRAIQGRIPPSNKGKLRSPQAWGLLCHQGFRNQGQENGQLPQLRRRHNRRLPQGRHELLQRDYPHKLSRHSSLKGEALLGARKKSREDASKRPHIQEAVSLCKNSTSMKRKRAQK